MNTVAGAVALIAILLLPLCIAAGVWVFRRLTGNRGHWGWLLAAAAILLVAVGAALVGGGRPIDGIVRQKTEQIQIAQTGLLPDVLHILRVVVIPSDAGAASGSLMEQVSLAVDASSFDRLTEGRIVNLRVARFGPLTFARLAELPWWNAFAMPQIQRFWPWAPAPGAARSVSARVTAIRTVREALLRSWSRRRSTLVFHLPQAYDEVTLRLQGADGSAVTAVDRIDSGSVPGLAVGQMVAALVPDSGLRAARLAGGTRRFARQAWRARVDSLLPQIAAGGGVALLLAWGFVTLIRRKRRRAA